MAAALIATGAVVLVGSVAVLSVPVAGMVAGVLLLVAGLDLTRTQAPE